MEPPGRRMLTTPDDETCGPIGKKVPVRGVRRLLWLQQVANEAQLDVRFLPEKSRGQYLIKAKDGTGRVFQKKLPMVVMEQEIGQEEGLCLLSNQQPPDLAAMERECELEESLEDVLFVTPMLHGEPWPLPYTK